VELVQHVTDDTRAQFAGQILPDSEAAPLEEHLLICLDCAERLLAELEFVAAMRGARAQIREVESPSGDCCMAPVGRRLALEEGMDITCAAPRSKPRRCWGRGTSSDFAGKPS
jgi:hypothetical protein